MNIIALIGAIPQLISLFADIFAWIKNITKEDPAAFIAECHAVFAIVTSAKSPEEKSVAAGKVQDLIRKLG